ncbi:MAG: hypothetical protein OQK79_11710 [Rhodanobacter sp.]|nr:hypothetical protein [Rhodanobacter sp.]
MANSQELDSRHPPRFLLLPVLAVLGLLLPLTSVAADAHNAVIAKPGEIVLLRNVATRPAARPAPPGMALIGNPSPRTELDQALGVNELSDAEYASLGGSPSGVRGQGTTVERTVQNALGGSLGSGTGSRGVAGDGMSSLIAVPLGSVGRTTGNINNQIQGALSQLPGMPTTPAIGH